MRQSGTVRFVQDFQESSREPFRETGIAQDDNVRSYYILPILVLGLVFAAAAARGAEPDGEKAHAAVAEASSYPSATECAVCHQRIYEEWRSSSHAYASISPMFHKFEQLVNTLSAGTMGTFCVRCHLSVGTLLKEPRELAIWKRSKVSLEGITCITCHRINENFGRVSGERRIVPGDIFQPTYGPIGGAGVAEVMKNRERYKVASSADERGMNMHKKGIKFDQLSRSSFCVSCHQVTVYPGIKLEVVWDQYRASPALKQGITCQDCHMGKTPGRADGYARGPAAVVNGKAVNRNRRHANHAFYGPGYPIAHPGIFPHHPDRDNFTLEAWLKFDYRAGWGTEEFEDKLDDEEIEVDFPEEWSEPDDRIDAREIVTSNEKKLAEKMELRRQVMENGLDLVGPFFEDTPEVGESLDLYYTITNTNLGHNSPSGSLGAQPQIWLNVALIGPDGKNVWESGYVDSQGDVADIHSFDVAQGKIERDSQLFNLQTMFLVTNLKGTDREFPVPINFDIDQLPFIRPAPQPITVINHPPLVRMEGRSIAPLGSRDAEYTIPGSVFSKPGKYRLAVRFRSRAEPIYFMSFVGATAEMKRRMNEWMLDFNAYTVEFEVK